MKTALIAVDVQKDFIDGSFPVPYAKEIIDPLVKLAKEMDLVVASRDWHPKQHMSFEAPVGWPDNGGKYPPHCIQDTPGARITPKIRKLAHYIVSKGMERDSDAFSAFVGQTMRPKRMLIDILHEHEIERVIVGGLPLDQCVMWTALDAAAYGFLTIVGFDIARGFTPTGEAVALEAFRRAGVQVQSAS